MSQQSENALAIVGAPKSEAERPLPMDEPAMDGEAEPVTIELTALVSRVEPPHDARDENAAEPPRSAQRLFPLAASIMLAALVGAVGGGAATFALWRSGPNAAAVAAALSDETHALQDKVAKLSSEIAAMKSGIDAANRASSQQLGKIGERLERAEKAQAEPAAKLAKIAEGLDRLERRTASAAPDVTGSITSVEKQQVKPPVIEGWRLVDFYAGRAVLESRNGTLYEVAPGANLPGIGRVETIKRVDGKIVVTTQRGIITSSLEAPRRMPYHLPRGY